MLVGAFDQEKALVGAFSVIVKTDGSFAAFVPLAGLPVDGGPLVPHPDQVSDHSLPLSSPRSSHAV